MDTICKHCSGSGTCSTGEGGVSCERCVNKQSRFRKISSPKGLPCSVCYGVGDIMLQGKAFKAWIVPGLGLLIISIGLLLVATIGILNVKLQGQVLTLLGTLAGSVVGYYFSSRNLADREDKVG